MNLDLIGFYETFNISVMEPLLNFYNTISNSTKYLWCRWLVYDLLIFPNAASSSPGISVSLCLSQLESSLLTTWTDCDLTENLETFQIGQLEFEGCSHPHIYFMVK